MTIAAFAIGQLPIAAQRKTAAPKPPSSRQAVAVPDATAAPEPR